MTLTEKKINQTLNMLQLIHDENLVIFSLIKGIVTPGKDPETFESYIKQCQNREEQILSGVYEEDVTITS